MAATERAARVAEVVVEVAEVGATFVGVAAKSTPGNRTPVNLRKNTVPNAPVQRRQPARDAAVPASCDYELKASQPAIPRNPPSSYGPNCATVRCLV